MSHTSSPSPGVPTATDRLLLAACALLHAVLGWALLPGALFEKYTEAARMLHAGRLAGEQSTDFSPLYLLLHAVLPPTAVHVLQVLAGAGTVLLVGSVAHRLGGRVAAVGAALAGALAAPLLVYEPTLEPDLLITALTALLLWWVVVRRGLDSLAGACVAGAMAGVSAGLRPTALLLAGVMAAAALLGGAGPRAWRAARAVALVVTALLVSSVPSSGVRAWAGGEVRTTMSVGQVFHHGNRPEGTGMGATPLVLLKLQELQERSPDAPDHAHGLYRRFARAALGEAASAGDTEAYWLRQALVFARREPLALARLWGRKVLNFLAVPHAHDIAQVRAAEAGLHARHLLPAVLLNALGLAGLVVGLLRRRPVGWPLAFVGAHLALCLGFYVVARYQLPVVPVWCVGTGLLAWGVAEAVRQAEARRALAFGGLVLAGLWSLSLHMRDAGRLLERGSAGWEDMQRALRLRAQGREQEALAAFIRAQAAQPYVRVVHDLRGLPFESPEVAAASAADSIQRFGLDSATDAFYAARLSMLAGHCEQALPLLERLAEEGFRSTVFDLSLDPDLLAAECLLQQGAREAAQAHAEAALARTPGGLHALAAVAEGSTAPTRAEEAREELRALHDPLSADYALAQAALTWGHPERALAYVEHLLAAMPETGVGHYERARALAALGRHAEALEAYEKALQLFPGHAFPTAPLDASLAAERARTPERPELLSLAAEHAFRKGQHAEARALLAQARQLFHGQPSAQQRWREAHLRSGR